MYVTKYLVLLSLVLAVVLLRRGRGAGERVGLPTSALVVVGLLSFGWGITETMIATGRNLQATLGRDEARSVAARFREISREEPGRWPDTRSLILYTNLAYADTSPALAPQPVLWSPHTPAFAGVSHEENKERIYLLLYFTGFDETMIDEQSFEKLDYQKQYLVRSLVGWGYASAAWSVNWRPLRFEEIQDALRDYRDYRLGFDHVRAAHLPLSYAVTATDEGIDFSNLDRWYVRDEGERIGKFILYRVRLR
jgi:hypothetical protein